MALKSVSPLAIIGKKPHPLIILTALPSREIAEKVATALVEKQLAACVNIIPDVASVYYWDGEVVHDHECKLIIKTSSLVEMQVIDFIKTNHPYTVPEITVIGHKSDVFMQPDYWSWLSTHVKHRR
ncbi:MAG TPA: divalent-cation tolerance protein CutA [Turneriella sp.]|nr:divalent-cation tolerance protein CutA [Turneriella sp.]